MSRIIISFLGTGGYKDRENKSRGEYKTAMYEIEGKQYESQFVSEVLFKHYNADKVIYIGTLKSMWDVVYDSYVAQPIDNIWEQLAESIEIWGYESELEEGKIIKDAFENEKVQPLLIKYGLNKVENEFNIRQLFEIEKLLNNGDEVYIDITHGFRSMPIVLVGVLNFIIGNIKKNIKISNISYGMFEVSHEMGGKTPIVDLNILLELQDNIKASHEFVEYGNAYVFSKLLNETDKSMSKILLDFSYAKSLNHLKKLKGLISSLKGFSYQNLTEIQKLTIPVIVNNFLKRFDKVKVDSQYQYEIANWMYDNKQFGYAYIILTEALITNRVERLEKRHPKSEIHKIRDFKGKRDFAKKTIEKGDRELRKIYRNVNQRRISVAHAKESGKSIRESVNELQTALKEIKKFIYSENNFRN